MDFARFCGVLKSFTEFHGISQNPVEFAEIPEFRARPEILRFWGQTHTIRHFEIKHEIPRNSTKSHEIPRNPTKFHEIPRNSTNIFGRKKPFFRTEKGPNYSKKKYHEIFVDKTAFSHKKVRPKSKNHELPRNPTKFHEIPPSPPLREPRQHAWPTGTRARMPATRARPTHAFASIRVGEASNPGPLPGRPPHSKHTTTRSLTPLPGRAPQ